MLYLIAISSSFGSNKVLTILHGKLIHTSPSRKISYNYSELINIQMTIEIESRMNIFLKKCERRYHCLHYFNVVQ